MYNKIPGDKDILTHRQYVLLLQSPRRNRRHPLPHRPLHWWLRKCALRESFRRWKSSTHTHTYTNTHIHTHIYTKTHIHTHIHIYNTHSACSPIRRAWSQAAGSHLQPPQPQRHGSLVQHPPLHCCHTTSHRRRELQVQSHRVCQGESLCAARWRCRAG